MNPRVITGPSAILTGSITTGSAVVTGLDVSSMEGAVRVAGTGIPRGTLVRSFDSDSQITLNREATAVNAAAELTFGLEPVTIAEAMDHLRLEITDDPAALLREEAKVAMLITASRQLCEGWYSRSLITTTLRYMIDAFPQFQSGYWPYALRIPWADLLEINSVAYMATDGSAIVLGTNQYQVMTGAPGRVIPSYGGAWPEVRGVPEAVSIEFTAGHGPTADYVSETTKAGLLLLLGHLYENREGTVTTSIGLKEAPLGVQTLLSLEDWGYRG